MYPASNPLYTYLSTNQLLYGSQHGFRKQHSTETAILELRRFALAFIHSHSGATGVFRNAFMGSRGSDFLFTKNTADDIGSFTAACVVGALGAINCEYRQTFMFAMCGIVTSLM